MRAVHVDPVDEDARGEAHGLPDLWHIQLLLERPNPDEVEGKIRELYLALSKDEKHPFDEMLLFWLDFNSEDKPTHLSRAGAELMQSTERARIPGTRPRSSTPRKVRRKSARVSSTHKPRSENRGGVRTSGRQRERGNRSNTIWTESKS
jgi:hypothetical protein